MPSEGSHEGAADEEISIKVVAEVLGVSRSRADTVSRELDSGFPAPSSLKRRGNQRDRFWRTADIIRFSLSDRWLQRFEGHPRIRIQKPDESDEP